MQVILKVVSGPSAGRKFWLRPGDYTEVGSKAGVDFTVNDNAMDRVHFMLECTHQGCKIYDGESPKPTFVNGEEIQAEVLADGDHIKAGDSLFLVTIEGKVVEEEVARSENAWPKIAAEKAATVCALYDVDAEKQPLLKSDPEPELFITQLVEQKIWGAATEFLAYALPKREAIWWLCQMIRENKKFTGPKQEAALEGAEKWVREPGDEARRAACDLSDQAGLTTPAGLAAMAVFYSGGSLAPPELDDVEPEETLTARICRGGLTLCAVRDRFPEANVAREQIVTAGIAIAKGAETWNDKPAPAAPPTAGD